jgi:hypothetical protein
MPYIISFLAVVIPAFGAWIVAQLKTNHTVAVNAAAAANQAASAVAAHSLAANTQLASIEQKVDGAMSAMAKKADDSVQAQLADKDAQIAALKAKP